ncbi:hypothetical protein GCM10010193_69340 [Kitasatospora atroaurantiaca]|uniref:Uncharacterized protein n=1 Tax=Kitasatospora atroaurantiaca TaxID=285545 RepID=A0A561EN26_9ACTN|nr:hypothetical protein [Kitasatospora atroaurantiaca]TWE17023.1 hypothetical protein FB465_2025 [Kitasatospora atroaurantiaca]
MSHNAELWWISAALLLGLCAVAAVVLEIRERRAAAKQRAEAALWKRHGYSLPRQKNGSSR